MIFGSVGLIDDCWLLGFEASDSSGQHTMCTLGVSTPGGNTVSEHRSWHRNFWMRLRRRSQAHLLKKIACVLLSERYATTWVMVLLGLYKFTALSKTFPSYNMYAILLQPHVREVHQCRPPWVALVTRDSINWNLPEDCGRAEWYVHKVWVEWAGHNFYQGTLPNLILPLKLKYYCQEVIYGPLDGASVAPDQPWPYKGRDPSQAFLYEIVANKSCSIDVDKVWC